MTVTTSSSTGGGARGVTVFYRVVAVLLAAFFAGIALISLAVWVKNGHIASLVSVIPLLWLAYAALGFVLVRRLVKSKWTAAAVFVFALLPRLALSLVHTYTPTSDFLSYWQMGQAFLRGDSSVIAAVVDNSHVYEFAGVGILEGVMQFLSGRTPLGYQILQIVLTAGIAVLVLRLGSRLGRPVGLTAAVLYALYPSGIVMAQVFTNQHLAVFLALLSILLYLHGLRAEGLGRRIGWGALAGFTLLVSHYAHPSSIVTRIAFLTYAVLLCFDDKKHILRILCVPAACLILFSAGNALIERATLALGYRLPETRQSCVAEGILTGLTYETDGLLDSALRDEYRALTADEQRAAILHKLTEPAQVLKLLARKAAKMWGAMDSSFIWYTHETNETEATLAVSTALGALDMVFVACVYLLAAIGLVRRRNTLRPFALYQLIVAGWIGVYLVYEIQMRYRYYAMPFLMIFAALGIAALKRRKKENA